MGRHFKITPKIINSILGLPNIGIKSCPGSDIEYTNFSPEMANFKLTHSENMLVTVHNLDVHDRLLLHLINQILIPKVNKSKNPTGIELFYMWCVHHSFHLNLGYTILSHIKLVVSWTYYATCFI